MDRTGLASPRCLPLLQRLQPLLLLFLLPVLASGLACRPAANSPQPAAPDRSSAGSLTADEILERLAQAYSQATGYQDQGVVRLQYRQDGQDFQDEAPLRVRFARPDRLVLEAYQLQLSCDAGELRARVQDPQTNDLDGQWVVRPAPAALGLQELYADPVIDNVLRSGLGRYPVQLELLLGDQPLQGFRQPDATRQLLEPAAIEGQACHRVAVDTAEGRFVLWVDQADFLLRRLEYPEQVLRQMVAEGDDVQQVRLAAEFRAAEFAAPPAGETLHLAIPEDAQQVRAFVLPPEPLPTNLYGRQLPPFHFTRLDGQKLTGQDLLGKVVVLVWYSNHPACRPALEQVSGLRTKFAGRDDLELLAVCTDPTTESNQTLQKLLDQWQVELPLVRDLEAFGRDLFAIPAAPTLIVLDRQGQVQVFEVGTSEELAEQLPELVQRLLDGQDLANQLVAAHRIERENYRRLVASGGAAETTVLEVPKTPLRPASQPKSLVLKKLWTCQEFQAAGNLSVVEAAQAGSPQPRILAFDGPQTIVELSQDGQVLGRRTLELPADVAATYLRSGRDGQGRQFHAVSALRGTRVLVYDENWQQVGAYPPADQPHEGIDDTLLADLDGDGEQELYVGFWGTLGVHSVDLAGNRRWTNRSTTNVLTLALAPPAADGPRDLLASSDLGPIRQITASGRELPPREVTDRSIHHLYGAFHPERGTHYCGLSYQGVGQMLVLGLSAADFSELWNYELPAGTYETEIQFVAACTLPDGEPAWALAGPDGSVHLVRADGGAVDHFGTGTALTGIATMSVAGRQVLLLASGKQVTAWEMSGQTAP
ncbi:MAG: TlpA family protein disulfide reductase [Pirellulaceae bacterium]|nr:TlpA family protein disulfide reductase [Pirellulaceae bacterium]